MDKVHVLGTVRFVKWKSVITVVASLVTMETIHTPSDSNPFLSCFSSWDVTMETIHTPSNSKLGWMLP